MVNNPFIFVSLPDDMLDLDRYLLQMKPVTSSPELALLEVVFEVVMFQNLISAQMSEGL